MQPGLVHLVNYASTGPLVDPTVLVPLVDQRQLITLADPVTAGPISRCSHSLYHQWSQL